MGRLSVSSQLTYKQRLPVHPRSFSPRPPPAWKSLKPAAWAPASARRRRRPRSPRDPGKAGPPRAVGSVHQVAAEDRPAARERGGRAAPAPIGACADPALSVFSQTPSQVILFRTLYSEVTAMWNLKGTSLSKRQNGRGLRHFSLMERKTQGNLFTPQIAAGGTRSPLSSGLII